MLYQALVFKAYGRLKLTTWFDLKDFCNFSFPPRWNNSMLHVSTSGYTGSTEINSYKRKNWLIINIVVKFFIFA